jgi:tRNA A-37 threonylcarbamoyl transferase component Bud32
VAEDALVGRELGRYLIEGVLGSGSFAVVYRAVDTVLERTVALKVVDPSSHRNPTIGRRFVLEGKAVASLDHPAVVPVYDAGDHDGVLWMAMRLVEGRSVDQALAAGRRFRPDEVVAVVERIGSALDHAHSRGVVHRDVKPSNLLLEHDDPYRAHLADFGIAATARSMGQYTTGTLGTAAYMAPEQVRPSEVGPPADIYSLGCVAYELLMGRRPFPGDDHMALLYAHATDAPHPVGHPAVDAVMSRALAKSPDGRPPSGAALACELAEALTAAGWPPLTTPVGVAAAAAGGAGPSPVATVAADADGPDTTVAQSGHPTPESPLPVPPPASGAVRPGRRKARRRLLVGVALLVAAGAAIVAVLDWRSSPSRRVNDAAGISYELAGGWDVGAVEPPSTTLVDGDGREVATITHLPTTGADADAVEALADAGPSLCEGDPVAGPDLDGSDLVARCDNPDGTEPATAVAAVAGDQIWVITLAAEVTAEQRDDFLASVRLS